ncbi:unnamed protein product, partial [Didymodactylos carnosus]
MTSNTSSDNSLDGNGEYESISNISDTNSDDEAESNSEELSDDSWDSDNEEEEDEPKLNNLKWNKWNIEPNLPTFDGQFGLNKNISSATLTSPIDYFRLFLSPSIVTYIVDQSNLYRTQMNLKQEPMTEREFFQLLGFLFYASVVRLSSKSDYWSQLYQQALITTNITRNRISELLCTLHFNDNVLNSSKVNKIQPLIDLFNEGCSYIVEQEKNISLDEQMVGYKGTTAPKSLRQYMPNKPTKRGFKFWVRCGVSAYVYKLVLYCGGAKSVSHPAVLPKAFSSISTRSTTKATTNNNQIKKRCDDTK